MSAAITWSDAWQAVGLASLTAVAGFAGWFAFKVVKGWDRPVVGVKSRTSLDRNLVYTQWWIGAGLVVFGAGILIAYHYAAIFPGSDEKAMQTVTYVATAIIGAGIAALPTTSGGAASARISAAAAAVASLAPVVETGGVDKDETATDKVVLHGTVDPKGEDTTFFFQYRAPSDTDYTQSTKFKKIGAALTGQAAAADSEAVSGIENGWHYRIVAFHDKGALVVGDDKEVTGL